MELSSAQREVLARLKITQENLQHVFDKTGMDIDDIILRIGDTAVKISTTSDSKAENLNLLINLLIEKIISRHC